MYTLLKRNSYKFIRNFKIYSKHLLKLYLSKENFRRHTANFAERFSVLLYINIFFNPQLKIKYIDNRNKTSLQVQISKEL